MELPDLPDEWRLKSLIEKEGLWLAYVYTDDYWIQATGSTPRFAMLDAIQRIENEAWHETLRYVHREAASGPNLIKILNIQPVSKERRRA